MPRPKKARTAAGSLALTSSTRLAKILKAVGGEIGCSDWLIRQDVGCASDLRHALVHKETLETKKGGEYIWEFFEPNRLVAYVVERCPELADCYARAANAHLPTPEHPWEITCSFDEFVPGEKLSGIHTRKSMVLGFNFVQLGDELIHKDYTWFIPIVVRTSEMNEVKGGWAHMLAKYFRLQLFGPSGLATAGLIIMINGQPLQIFAKVVDLLPDYDGIRIGWDWRGANSLRPCPICSNVWRKDGEMAGRVDGVEITCTDKLLLIERTDADFADDVDMVTEAGDLFATGRIGKGRFLNILKVTGQNYNPLGWVADEELRAHMPPITVMTQGWVHGVLSDGILGNDMWVFIQQSSKIGFDMRTLEGLFLESDLRFPQSLGTKGACLWRIFSDTRYGEDTSKIKGDASELLGCYALMRHFIEVRFQHTTELEAERKSFFACCKVVDIILQMKNKVIDPAAESSKNRLEDAVFNHLGLHIAAYGYSRVKPKCHLNHGLAKQFWRKGRVPDEFEPERLHLRVREHAELYKNVHYLAPGVLSRVATRQIEELRAGTLSSGLRGKVHQDIDEAVAVSRTMECAGLKVSVHDMVCVPVSRAGLVRSCCRGIVDSRLYVIVELLEFRGRVTDHSSLWRQSGVFCEFDADELSMPRSWYLGLELLALYWKRSAIKENI